MSEIKSIPTINLKGKEYTEVKDRVMFFRMEEQFKGFYLITEPLTLTDEIASFVCRVYNAEGVIVSTGTAYERASQGPVNKKDHVENCETSAVGRALGFLGIGIVGGIATAENMASVENGSTPHVEVSINELQRVELALLIQETQTDLAKFNSNFIIDNLAALPIGSFQKAKAMLIAKQNKMKREAKNVPAEQEPQKSE